MVYEDTAQFSGAVSCARHRDSHQFEIRRRAILSKGNTLHNLYILLVTRFKVAHVLS